MRAPISKPNKATDEESTKEKKVSYARSNQREKEKTTSKKVY